MPKVESAIPVGTQFAPTLVDLKAFVRVLVESSGDKGAILQGIWAPDVRVKLKDRPTSPRNRSLPVEAAVQYGLLTARHEATHLARVLAALDNSAMHEAFARHILLNLGGLRVLSAIREMQADGVKVTGDDLARHLTRQGFRVTVHNTAINSLRLWLEQAGVFRKGWEIDEPRVEGVLGLSQVQVGLLAQLTNEQQAFVDTLCRLNPSGPVSAARVRDLAEATSGLSFERQSLPKAVLEPLRRIGLIEYMSGGTKGGKSATLQTTSRFQRDVLQPFLARTLESLDPAVAAYYEKRPSDIFGELSSQDRVVKGQALEALGVYAGMRLLGLRFVAWRKRAPETGGAEVDAIMAGVVGVVPTLWQIQAKNTPSGHVSTEDVSRELGLVPLTKASHILLLANCRIAEDAKFFARKAMDDQPVTIFLVGGSDFERVRREGSELVAILRDQAMTITAQRSQEAKRLAGR